jgi:transposase
MTLVSVTAYHSFGGEVEASNTPTIRRLTPSCRHQLPRIAPGYAPELNPDELVWSHMKRTGTAKRPLASDESLQERIEADLIDIQNNRALVRSFFKAPDVAYIADG